MFFSFSEVKRFLEDLQHIDVLDFARCLKPRKKMEKRK